MPMTAVERRRVLAAIGQSLEVDVHLELMTFFAQAVAFTEKVPDQVNNELRNALTHFSRAYSAASYLDAEADLRRAAAHIDRAKRDCLKLSIICLHERIQALCGQVKAVSGTLDPAFLARRNQLTADRKQVLRDEISGAGSDGERGQRITSGTGMPSPPDAIPGDLYVDSVTGDLWQFS